MTVSKAFCEIEEETLRRHSWLVQFKDLFDGFAMVVCLQQFCIISYHNHYLTNVIEAWMMKKLTYGLNIFAEK